MNDTSTPTRFGSGNAVRRVEDMNLLTGAGVFADDVSVPNQASMVILRSPHAHARIAAIDVAAAKMLPGVIAVITGADLVAAGLQPLPQSADFRRADGSPTAAPPQHALAVEAVRYVGEAVAAVIAESVAAARDAAEAIDIDYEPLPMVVSMTDAVAAVTDSRKAARVNRLAGRLTATLSYGQIDEIVEGGLHAYLDDIRRQFDQLHSAIQQTYIAYSIESARLKRSYAVTVETSSSPPGVRMTTGTSGATMVICEEGAGETK